MASTFGLFESAKSGLSVAMQQLNVTEQNIANVNTEGYTRQRMLTSAKEPPISEYLIAQLSKTAVGQGVEATGIQQIRSEYLDQQYRSLNAGYNYTAKRDESLTYLTGLYNELKDSGTIKSSIKNFFSALNTFAGDTSSKEFRTNVQQQALSMTQSFNNVYEEMESLWHEQNDSINTVAQKINSIAEKIAQLNESIAGAVQTGGTANDLNDERNLLLDELSGYVNITYSWNEKNDNMIDVKIGGLPLVEGKTVNKITVDSMADNGDYVTAIDGLLDAIVLHNTDPTNPVLADLELEDLFNSLRQYADFKIEQANPTDPNSIWTVSIGGVELVTEAGVTMSFKDAADIDLTAWVEFNRNRLTLDDPATDDVIETLDFGGAVTGGQLYSNMEMITSNSPLSPGIPYYMDQLNIFVREMAENLNTISRRGWTYPDGDNSSLQGINLFNVPSYDNNGTIEYQYFKVTAGNFTLSNEVLESPYNIAGSSSKIILTDDSTQSGNNYIANDLFKDLIKSSYYDKMNSIVGSLGIAANTCQSIMSTKNSLLVSVDTQRKSLSSVSLDEEATNLIIFQQSYNAAARIISVLDEMLNTMINNMGITGR
ncbi:MAG: flagellar hook-associated protein FlgK [Clostridiales bacterium]|nr:flagellar hook-associated protein FlgK [Clostridiales bacterium]